MTVRSPMAKKQCHRGRGDVDRPPAEEVGDKAADRPREQDADQRARRDRADHPATPLGLREFAGQRSQQLRADGGQSDTAECGEEHSERRSERGAQEHGGGQGQDDRNETAPVEEVTERHDEEDAQRVSDLSDSHQRGGARRRRRRGRLTRQEKRLHRPSHLTIRLLPSRARHRSRADLHRRPPSSPKTAAYFSAYTS